MKYMFETVSTKRTHRWKENGKNRQETREFSQTVNPFNKNKKGKVKTYAEILDEINEEADVWLKARRSVFAKSEEVKS